MAHKGIDPGFRHHTMIQVPLCHLRHRKIPDAFSLLDRTTVSVLGQATETARCVNLMQPTFRERGATVYDARILF